MAYVVAFVAFIATTGLVAFIMYPRTWMFSHDDLVPYIDQLKQGLEVDPKDFGYNLSRDFNAWRKDNIKPLKHRQTAHQVTCILLGVQVVAWSLATL